MAFECDRLMKDLGEGMLREDVVEEFLRCMEQHGGVIEVCYGNKPGKIFYDDRRGLSLQLDSELVRVSEEEAAKIWDIFRREQL